MCGLSRIAFEGVPPIELQVRVDLSQEGTTFAYGARLAPVRMPVEDFNRPSCLAQVPHVRAEVITRRGKVPWLIRVVRDVAYYRPDGHNPLDATGALTTAEVPAVHRGVRRDCNLIYVVRIPSCAADKACVSRLQDSVGRRQRGGSAAALV